MYLKNIAKYSIVSSSLGNSPFIFNKNNINTMYMLKKNIYHIIQACHLVT